MRRDETITSTRRTTRMRRLRAARAARAFTLIELVVVMAIIGVLMATLLPSLSMARQRAREVTCGANLRSVMEAILVYSAGNEDAVIPSYNMTGVSGGFQSPLEGWASILHKESLIRGSREFGGNAFCCPNTLDIPGVEATQTGSDPQRPKGYMEWPAVVTLSQTFASPMPGYEDVLRVGYWINGDNPLGIPQLFVQGIHFTGSVGYGPDPAGKVMRQNKFSQFIKPANLVALADGLYAGKQELTRVGDVNSRIGYRHPGLAGSANAVFGDGHVTAIAGDKFPRKFADNITLEQARADNLGDRPTVYSNPNAYLNP